MQPVGLGERLGVARDFLRDYPVFTSALWVDTMTNGAATAYAALPERLFVILDGVCVYVGGYGPDDYSVDEVRGWLAAHV